jgi:integrase
MLITLRRELGDDFSLVPEILRDWHRTGEHLSKIELGEAVDEFLAYAEKEFPNKRTLSDIKSRLDRFKSEFGSRFVHEITVTEIEHWLAQFEGWDRWSFFKRVRPFYKFAKRRRWIAANPMEEIPTPRTPTPERAIYTPDQFETLLIWAESEPYNVLTPFLVLSGFCFLRTSELVRLYRGEQVLQWEDIIWEENLVHVRPGVAKSTKRDSGDERFVPLNEAAKSWLSYLVKVRKVHGLPITGECIPISHGDFSDIWIEMTDKAEVPRIPNGLRHSAISYSLAANPEHGVALTSQWAGNSEATIRKHYRRLIKPDVAARWFNVSLDGTP